MTAITTPRLRFALKTIAASAILACASGQIYAQGNNHAPNPRSVRAGESITLNFIDADIDAVARTMATITGRNVVVDPRVKGKVTLVTENAVSPNTAMQQFLVALRLQGFTAVESSGLYKIVPEADAKIQGGSVSIGSQGTAQAGQIVTQIFKLNFENAANLVPVLRPLISPNNTININPGNNSLVITDYADNLQRLARIVAAMDVSNASDVEVIALHNAIATDLLPLLTRLVEGGSAANTAVGGGTATPGQSDTSFRTTMMAEPRSNSIILRAANPARLSLVRALIAKLDQPAAPGSSAASGNIHVVYLKNADATKLAVTLRAAMSSAYGAGSAGGAASGGSFAGSGSNNIQRAGNSTSPNNFGGSGSSNDIGASGGTLDSNANQPSTGGQIQADPSTNSLIISATEPQYRQLRNVIDRLDSRRAQVLVESLIVEVSTDKAAEFGVQWQGVIGKAALGTNFGQGNSNLVNLATGIATGNAGTSLNPGLNLGIAQKIGGSYVLSALARLMDQTGSGNVLSTPNLLTLDNEEAKIVIGQNVPFVTGQYTNTGGSSTSVNPFQTIERKDVGLTLRVRPQISENGTVKMAIYQEVSSVDATTKSALNGPTTNKRSIESNVLVNDGSIIVLGGLLQDEYSGNVEKVPLLGDIPVLGNLFRSENRSRKKTNLMVFLRPVVVRDGETSDAVSMDRYDMMRVQQQGMRPSDHPLLSAVPDANLLPELPRNADGSLPARKPGVPTPLITLPSGMIVVPAPGPEQQLPAAPATPLL